VRSADSAADHGSKYKLLELRSRRRRRWGRDVLIGGILVALFLAFLYYIMQPHNYSGEGQ
jgi:hypothetical protein